MKIVHRYALSTRRLRALCLSKKSVALCPIYQKVGYLWTVSSTGYGILRVWIPDHAAENANV